VTEFVGDSESSTEGMVCPVNADQVSFGLGAPHQEAGQFVIRINLDHNGSASPRDRFNRDRRTIYPTLGEQLVRQVLNVRATRGHGLASG